MSNAPQQLSTVLKQGRRHQRGTLILAGLVILALGAGLAWWMQPKQNKIQFITVPATRTNLHVDVTADGSLEPERVVSLGSSLSGVVDQVLVDVNDPVHKGQVLIELDKSVLQAKLQKAQAALAMAKARVNQAEVNLGLAQDALKRAQALRLATQNRLPSPADFEAKQAQEKERAAELTLAKANVADAQASVSVAQEDLSKATIRSPIDGVVLARKVEPGYAVAASLQAVELLKLATSLNTLELKIHIDEADIGVVHPGQKATFTVSAYPNQPFDATFTKIAFGASQNGNVVTYTGYLTVDNHEHLLRPGMSATASIATGQAEDALVVPNSAFRYEPQVKPKEKAPVIKAGPPHLVRHTKHRTESVVHAQQTRTLYVDRQGQAVPVSVTTGLNDGSFTQIIDGDLKAGDLVIIDQKKPQ